MHKGGRLLSWSMSSMFDAERSAETKLEFSIYSLQLELYNKLGDNVSHNIEPYQTWLELVLLVDNKFFNQQKEWQIEFAIYVLGYSCNAWCNFGRIENHWYQTMKNRFSPGWVEDTIFEASGTSTLASLLKSWFWEKLIDTLSLGDGFDCDINRRSVQPKRGWQKKNQPSSNNYVGATCQRLCGRSQNRSRHQPVWATAAKDYSIFPPWSISQMIMLMIKSLSQPFASLLSSQWSLLTYLNRILWQPCGKADLGIVVQLAGAQRVFTHFFV